MEMEVEVPEPREGAPLSTLPHLGQRGYPLQELPWQLFSSQVFRDLCSIKMCLECLCVDDCSRVGTSGVHAH